MKKYRLKSKKKKGLQGASSLPMKAKGTTKKKICYALSWTSLAF